METNVKLEAPETDLPAADSSLPSQTTLVHQDSDTLADPQEENTHPKYVCSICKSIDEDEELAAFRDENPNTYNAVKKMLSIVLSELETDNTTDNNKSPEVIVPEIIVNEEDDVNDKTGDTQASTETQAEPGQTVGVPSVQVTPTAKLTPPQVQNIDRYAVPPRTVSNAARPTGSDDTFTASEIHNFYKDVVRGRYKGREKEADALESRIFRAVKEGRVTA
ncbi:hypothetical protein [Candidatus Magnetominusculus xianensis]|uniref:Uncharacterized protein n=1 Tax=Candidatus Magnetominusculus xianensis TaxID=1748249 RepID=A0ABR5SJ77_9BACT|nr:hypothetical protein [Candidatus Magnetominusculus xianensis]KWT91832.1 hypothetical protein ASN18_0734 [Candidatus Magnetominusculus xianensis]MBF0403887.1 hypothetical protein [Nitrospirota bacterium]